MKKAVTVLKPLSCIVSEAEEDSEVSVAEGASQGDFYPRDTSAVTRAKRVFPCRRLQSSQAKERRTQGNC